MRTAIPLFAFSAAVCWGYAAPAAADQSAAAVSQERPPLLATLRPDHPRLLMDATGFQQLRSRISQDEVLRAWHQAILADAQGILDAAPSEYVIPDGKRLLATSRRVLHRAQVLSLAYWMGPDARLRDRLWRELEAAAAFKDWNPSHFLDTAEMTHAFAIAYDWLYHEWSDDQRRAIRAAIVRHGLTPGLTSYRGAGTYGWWVRSEHNWNQVCNGGMTAGALAIAEDEPQLAGEILQSALNSLPRAMASYAPDGGWGEGIGYWHYATSYNVMMLAALQSALGTDFGLSEAPGFAETGLYPIHLLSPSGLSFNFADVGQARATRAPELFWLARRFDRPLYAAHQRRHAAPDPLDLVWYPPEAMPSLARAAHFRGPQIVTMRSAWDDPRALFVGLKAGDNRVNHSHLDLGSFVLDALGQHWAVDLGSDDYNLPDYFGGQRWTYYRLRPEGHNTLVINPSEQPGQDPRAAAAIIRFQEGPERILAIADLSAAYAATARSAQRGILLLGDQRVIVQDEIQCPQPSRIWWFMHTGAEITIQDGGRLARLAQEGQYLRARLLEPADAQFTVAAAQPLATSPNPAGQQVNRSVRKLAIRLDEATNVRLVVAFEPEDGSRSPEEGLPPMRPLSEWNANEADAAQ